MQAVLVFLRSKSKLDYGSCQSVGNSLTVEHIICHIVCHVLRHGTTLLGFQSKITLIERNENDFTVKDPKYNLVICITCGYLAKRKYVLCCHDKLMLLGSLHFCTAL